MLSFRHVSYSYPQRAEPALRDVSLEVGRGEGVLVVGESGAGKSTLLRAINGLVPHFYGGCFGGQILVNGLDTRQVEPRDLSARVGFVFQDPEAQFVTSVVEDELVFAMENFGLPRATMARRVDEVVAQLAIAPLRRRRIATLSGGEKQRVAIASVLTLQPQILVLDEPTSQLDPQAAEEVLQAVARLRASLGLTVILAEHRLERVVAHVDRIVWLPGGGAPARIGPTRAMLHELPLVPPLVELARALHWEPLPLTVAEARERGEERGGRRETERQKAKGQWQKAKGTASYSAESHLNKVVSSHIPHPASHIPHPASRIEVEALSFAYGGRAALRNVSLSIGAGEWVAVMGHNGSGKSTLLRHMVGLLRPDAGAVRIAGESIAGRAVQEVARGVGYVPQNPNALLFAETVLEELLVTLRNHGLDSASAPIEPRALLARLGLAEVAAHYPRDLSAGQRERVALAAVLVTRPPILLLDEPTRGLDLGQKRALMEQLRAWQQEGATVVVVSHDVELMAQFAERVILLDGGAVIADGPTDEVLPRHPDFAPQMFHLFERPDWLTVADVLGSLDAPASSSAPPLRPSRALR